MSQTTRSHRGTALPTTNPNGQQPLLIALSDLPGPPEAHQFTGAEHGGVPISLFLVDDRPGAGPRLHRHPYPELFIVHGGQAEFEIDDVRVTAAAGDILVAPAQAAHRFTNTGDGRLRVTAIHMAPKMNTEWLPEQPAKGTPPVGGLGARRSVAACPHMR